MKLSRLSNRQLRRLLARGEVRFAINPKFFNRYDDLSLYKGWLEGIVKSCIDNLTGEVTGNMAFNLYKVPPETQRKVKTQITKIVTELKKLPGIVKETK